MSSGWRLATSVQERFRSWLAADQCSARHTGVFPWLQQAVRPSCCSRPSTRWLPQAVGSSVSACHRSSHPSSRPCPSSLSSRPIPSCPWTSPSSPAAARLEACCSQAGSDERSSGGGGGGGPTFSGLSLLLDFFFFSSGGAIVPAVELLLAESAGQCCSRRRGCLGAGAAAGSAALVCVGALGVLTTSLERLARAKAMGVLGRGCSSLGSTGTVSRSNAVCGMNARRPG